MSPHIIDITLENAQSMLVEESFKRPVVVDFWASWCEACKSLMPMLDKLANEYGGQFLLAKVDADELQMISGQFGVRSLPTVIVMKDGQPVDGFSGAQPEPAIREVLNKVLPKPWEMKLKHAQAHMEEGEYDEAHPLLREAYDLSEQNGVVAVTLADALTKIKRYSEAETVIGTIKLADQDANYEHVKAELELAQQAQKAPELQALEEKHLSAPEDKGISFQLAVQYSQHDYKEEALRLLYGILSREFNYQDGEAKKIFLDILAVLGKGDPIAAEYQRKLYTLLY